MNTKLFDAAVQYWMADLARTRPALSFDEREDLAVFYAEQCDLEALAEIHGLHH